MDALIQVILSGLTLGAMYALGSIGLALTYGTMRMFNMAHGVFMTLGAYPFAQPVQLAGAFRIAGSSIPYQSLAILVLAGILLGGMGLLLTRTRFGLSIRATAMNLEAAQLMGVRTGRTYLTVLLMAGALAGAAGVMISSLSTLSPEMGTNPAVRAFVICVVAGLGSVPGAGIAAIILGLFEAVVQFYVGARYGLPLMLGLVIIVLIFRPAGLFGRQEVVRS